MANPNINAIIIFQWKTKTDIKTAAAEQINPDTITVIKLNFVALDNTCLNFEKFIFNPTSNSIKDIANAVIIGLNSIIVLVGPVETNLKIGPISKPISINGKMPAILILLNNEFSIKPKKTIPARNKNRTDVEIIRSFKNIKIKYC